jgi:hypothetical protein
MRVWLCVATTPSIARAEAPQTPRTLTPQTLPSSTETHPHPPGRVWLRHTATPSRSCSCSTAETMRAWESGRSRPLATGCVGAGPGVVEGFGIPRSEGS